ncbi:MAG: hypothetical protein JWQ35_815 [Bacteriovoracaceae bacterium]|nr:hypothetical protein [Bacteriovoracaceae bacterium]
MKKRSALLKTAPLDSVEKRAAELLRLKIREAKLRPGDLAKALRPPLSESQLRHLLNGGSALTLDRFFQLSKLIQADPLELLHHSNPDPKFEQPFTTEQEMFLVSDPWRYRIMKALSLPRTERELVHLFPECRDVEKIVKQLLEKKIILELGSAKETTYRLNANAFQLATVDFVEGYTDLLLKNVLDIHDTTVTIEEVRPDLIKFIRNMMVVDYLTPEQMITLRDRLLSVFAEFRRFVGRNRMDTSYAAVAKENLVCLVTLMAPLNRATFLKRPKN